MDTNKTTTHIVKIIRITVDAGMYILFLLLMGYHLFENLHHEILGATVFVLFFIHNGLNWRWYKNLFKGKYTLSRSLQTGCNLLLCTAMLCTIAAALMLSRDVFYFLNLTNSGLGRKLHMVATVWTFLLEFTGDEPPKDARVKCLETHRPLMITSDGLNLVEDIGGVHGYCQFLLSLYGSEKDKYDFEGVKCPPATSDEFRDDGYGNFRCRADALAYAQKKMWSEKLPELAKRL